MNIEGFDYTTQQQVSKELTAWQELQTEVLAKGGTRRTQKGETFLRNKQCLIVYEIYGVIPLRRPTSG